MRVFGFLKLDTGHTFAVIDVRFRCGWMDLVCRLDEAPTAGEIPEGQHIVTVVGADGSVSLGPMTADYQGVRWGAGDSVTIVQPVGSGDRAMARETGRQPYSTRP